MNPIEDLEKLEETLVDQRRGLVIELWKIGNPPQTYLDSLIDIQRSIDAVKSAIEDEKSRSPSVYEDPATTV